jgi:pre-mRNA-splicing helicase BRR2
MMLVCGVFIHEVYFPTGLLRVFSMSTEFKTMTVREEEKEEIEAFIQKVPIPVKESADNPLAKTIILLQCHIAALPLAGSTLLADTVYVTQSASRFILIDSMTLFCIGYCVLCLN